MVSAPVIVKDQSMLASIGKKISVCLLTYNHAAIIESTIQSILDQTIDGYEVIVSDDCSSDGTWEKICDMSALNPSIRAIQTPRNLGMPGNANFAVAQSTRPYIALLHHDDVYRGDLLEKWAGILERHEGVSFVFNPYDSENAEIHYGPRLSQECVDGPWFLERFLMARWGCPVRGTAMIRRCWWDKVGGMREQFNLLADIDLWMRLSRQSQVGYVSETVIKPLCVRPDYYPDVYTGKQWHWERLIFLYQIHAINRLEYLPLNTLRGRLKWWHFRFRLSYWTARWLAYAVVKQKWAMIAASHKSVTSYDLWPLKAIRGALLLMFRRL